MNKITLSIAAAVLTTGLATGASAATTPAAPANANAAITFQAPKVPATQQASYFYRYRCYYFRYGYRVYRRCYVRYYYY
jgi:hypothetical protein